MSSPKNIIYPDVFIINHKDKSYEESMMELLNFVVNLLKIEKPVNIDFESNYLRGFSFESNNKEYYVRTWSITANDERMYIDYSVSFD
jgi:DNA polymerase elongation subunit (family B)